jgi:ribonuclease MRP protein subunit RMP1
MYRAFSNLIADNQYAALGLVLMGVLARVKRVIRPLGPARIVQDENENKLSTSGAANSAVILDLGEAVARGELGEVVTKDSDLDEHGEDEDHEVEVRKVKKKRKEPKEAKFKAQMQAQRVVEAIPTQRPKKKRKKGGDAFDDLFAGLI